MPLARSLPYLPLCTLAAGALLLPCAALAQAPQDAAYVPPEPHSFVVDSAHVIADSDRATLEDSLVALKAGTGAEVAVVTLPTIGDRASIDVALAIGRRWKVGRAAAVGDPTRHTGLVILYVPEQPTGRHAAVAILVGTGLQGFITDATAGAVRTRMVPLLRAHEVGAAMRLAVDTLGTMIRAGLAGAPVPSVAAQARRGVPSDREVEWVVVGFLLFSAGMAFAGWRMMRDDGVPHGAWADGKKDTPMSRDELLREVREQHARRRSRASSGGGTDELSDASSSDDDDGGDDDDGDDDFDGDGGGFDGGGASDDDI